MKVPTLTTRRDLRLGRGRPAQTGLAVCLRRRRHAGATKILGIVVVSQELAKSAGPGLEGVFHDLLITGSTAFTDKQFLIRRWVVPDVHPPSITNGVTPIAGTGDLPKISTRCSGPCTRVARVPRVPCSSWRPAPPRRDAQDVPLGASVVTSPAAAGIVVALDPRGVFVSDNGIVFDVSHEAMIELTDAPVGTAAAVLTSLWQANLAGYRVDDS